MLRLQKVWKNLMMKLWNSTILNTLVNCYCTWVHLWVFLELWTFLNCSGLVNFYKYNFCICNFCKDVCKNIFLHISKWFEFISLFRLIIVTFKIIFFIILRLTINNKETINSTHEKVFEKAWKTIIKKKSKIKVLSC